MDEKLIKKQFLNIKPSSTLQINEISKKLLDEGKEIYKFGLGQSPFPIPKIIVDHLKNNAFQKDYLNVSGLLELRKAVSKYHTKKNKYKYKYENIIIGPGSKELLFQCQMVIHAELILPAPSWVSYEPQAKFLNKKIYWLKTKKKNNWHLTASSLREHCLKHANKKMMLILNSPNNPTGTKNADLKKIADVCRDFNIIVISDEIYTELDFSGNYDSISHYYPEGTIITSGLSKWCGAGGWRLGTLLFPNELSFVCEKIRALASETFTSVSAPIQYAAVKAYSEDLSEYLTNSRKVLQTIGEYVHKELLSVGIECLKPQGGFYILCDFKHVVKKNNVINNATSLCEYLLSEIGLAMLPGINFGIEDDELITRIAFVDFDGEKALDHLKQNSKINASDFKILFPKITEGVSKLKVWINQQSNQ